MNNLFFKTFFLSIVILISSSFVEAKQIYPTFLVEVGAKFTKAETEALLSLPFLKFHEIEIEEKVDNYAQFEAQRKKDFQEAEDVYFSGDFEKAEKKFEQLRLAAVDNCLILCQNKNERERQFEVLVYLALITKDTKAQEETEQYLETAATLFPEMTVSPTSFPPWLIELYNKVKAALPEKTLTLTVEPDTQTWPSKAACEVALNGGDLSLGEQMPVVSGDYCISVSCDNAQRLIEKIEIKEDSVVVRPAMPKVLKSALIDGNKGLRTESFDMDDHDILFILTDILESKGLDKAAVATLKSTSINLWLVDLKQSRKHLVRLERSPVQISKTSEALVTFPVHRQMPKQFITRKKWYKNPLGWAVTATGLAMGLSGLAIGVSQGEYSSGEPMSWILQLSGISIATTGMVLLAIPSYSNQPATKAVGLTTTFMF